MAVLRSLLFNLLFYPATLLWVLASIAASVFGERPTHAVVVSWARMHYFLARHVLGIRSRVEGTIPPGPYLFAVKHQSMFETIEMVRLGHLPVVVMKRELMDIPLFGFVTRCYGAIPALGLPVVPIAVDSGQLWGRGLVKRSGIVTFKIGETIPPGLKRDHIEQRVHRAINAFELGA
jgi:1-acyl-sn-glycerol-3-phosphate acyltransferase